MCAFALTLCKYDLRQGDLFTLSWNWVRRVCLLWCLWLVVVCGISLFCDYGVCIVVRLVCKSCSEMVSRYVLMCVVYLVMLNVVYLMSL